MGILELNRTNVFLFLSCGLIALSGYYVQQRFAPFNMEQNVAEHNHTVQMTSEEKDNSSNKEGPTTLNTEETTSTNDKSD